MLDMSTGYIWLETLKEPRAHTHLAVMPTSVYERMLEGLLSVAAGALMWEAPSLDRCFVSMANPRKWECDPSYVAASQAVLGYSCLHCRFLNSRKT